MIIKKHISADHITGVGPQVILNINVVTNAQHIEKKDDCALKNVIISLKNPLMHSIF